VLSGPFSNFGKSGGLPPEIVPGFSFSANFRKWSRKFFTIFREILIKIVKKLKKWEFLEFGSAELVLSSQIRVIRRKRAICLINPYLDKNFTFFQKFDHFLANFRKKSKNRKNANCRILVFSRKTDILGGPFLGTRARVAKMTNFGIRLKSTFFSILGKICLKNAERCVLKQNLLFSHKNGPFSGSVFRTIFGKKTNLCDSIFFAKTEKISEIDTSSKRRGELLSTFRKFRKSEISMCV